MKPTRKFGVVIHLFLLDCLFVWLSSLSLLYHVASRKFFCIIGWEKAGLFAIFACLCIFFLTKFPHLRYLLKIVMKAKMNLWLRVIEIFLLSLVLLISYPTLIRPGHSELSSILSFIGCLVIIASAVIIFFIEKYVRPNIIIAKGVFDV